MQTRTQAVVSEDLNHRPQRWKLPHGDKAAYIKHCLLIIYYLHWPVYVYLYYCITFLVSLILPSPGSIPCVTNLEAWRIFRRFWRECNWIFSHVMIVMLWKLCTSNVPIFRSGCLLQELLSYYLSPHLVWAKWKINCSKPLVIHNLEPV